MTHSEALAIEVREATSADDAGVNHLFRTVFGVERSPEHFKWKVYDNPDGPMVAAVAVAGSDVVGYYGFWPTMLRLGGKQVLGGQALDLMVHPSHRSLPLALRLCERGIELASRRGMQLLYGMPNALALKLQVGKFNADHVGNLLQWVRILDYRQNLGIAGPRGWAVRAMGLLPLGSRKGYEVGEWRPDESELAEFLDRAKWPPGRIRVAPTAVRLLWRFGPNALRNYVWYAARQDGRLQGMVVVGDHTTPGTALLSDMLGVAEAPQVAALQHALLCLKRRGVTAVHAMGTAGPRDAVLKACGFGRRRVTQPLVAFKPMPVRLSANPHVFADWVLFGADHDVY